MFELGRGFDSIREGDKPIAGGFHLSQLYEPKQSFRVTSRDSSFNHNRYR
jgi:hypothetical protein